MNVDTQHYPPPSLMADPNFMSASQQHSTIDNSHHPQPSEPQAVHALQQTPPLPPAPPPTQYQKHQPLIGGSDPVASESYDAPTVGFSDSQADFFADHNEPYSTLSTTTRSLNMRYQLFLDRISPHWKARWTFSLVALMIFMTRVVVAQGWYVICYALAIYYLNLLIGFISPKVDPGMGSFDDDDLGDPMLPTHANDEFRPFIRRVPEFKFWISGTKATLISLFLSLFNIFDVPVFWPILLIYFIILFACTMRQQIRHMIRYSYVPWDSGKKKYAGTSKESSANLYPQTV